MRRKNRLGTILLCVLTCTLIAVSLGASTMHLALKSARASKQTLKLRQAQWLLDAGVQRSRLRITQGELADEVWQLPPSVLPQATGEVLIQVEETENADLRITVTALIESEATGQLAIRRTYSYEQPAPTEDDN